MLSCCAVAASSADVCREKARLYNKAGHCDSLLTNGDGGALIPEGEAAQLGNFGKLLHADQLFHADAHVGQGATLHCSYLQASRCSELVGKHPSTSIGRTAARLKKVAG